MYMNKLNEANAEALFNMMNNFRNYMLERKPHIKEYKKARILHTEVVNSMTDYIEKGKFKTIINDKKLSDKLINMYDNFNDDIERNSEVMDEIVIYKNSKKIYSLTEDYISKKKFRKEEKVEILNSMLNSKVGLYEIINTDINNGKVNLKDKLTNEEFCITDMALSGNLNTDTVYIYTRIITYNGISFGTGLSLIISKSNPLIQKWIKDNKKEYDKKEDIDRLIEIYEVYKSDSINIIKNNIKYK